MFSYLLLPSRNTPLFLFTNSTPTCCLSMIIDTSRSVDARRDCLVSRFPGNRPRGVIQPINMPTTLCQTPQTCSFFFPISLSLTRRQHAVVIERWDRCARLRFGEIRQRQKGKLYVSKLIYAQTCLHSLNGDGTRAYLSLCKS